MRGLAVSAAIVLAALASGEAARAQAGGPDFYRVAGVAPGDVLNMRAEPNAGARRLAVIPADAANLRNLGCVGGLTFAQWEKASEQERRRGRAARWCKVEWRGQTGWVAGRYLAE
jgi:hypothetical protein